MKLEPKYKIGEFVALKGTSFEAHILEIDQQQCPTGEQIFYICRIFKDETVTTGKISAEIEKLRREKDEAIKNNDYEHAATLRGKALSLDKAVHGLHLFQVLYRFHEIELEKKGE